MKRNNFDTLPFDVVTDTAKDSLDVMVLSLVSYCCRTKEKRDKVTIQRGKLRKRRQSTLREKLWGPWLQCSSLKFGERRRDCLMWDQGDC
jgi:hypothetical protein